MTQLESGLQAKLEAEVLRMAIEKLYSTGEAAAVTGLSRWTIHSYLSRGVLMRTKVGRRTMIRESQLLRLLEDGGKSPAPKRQVEVR